MGMLSIIILCIGDGLATIVGTHVKTPKLPWNKNKSWGGTTAFVVFAYVTCLGFSTYLEEYGAVPSSYFPVELAVVVIACALVESSSYSGDYDNLTVYLTAVILLVLCGY